MFVSCGKCKGMGFVRADRSSDADSNIRFTPCHVCKGSRGVDIPKGKILCPKCNGKKKFYNEKMRLTIRCNKCKAEGYIKKPSLIETIFN